MPKDILLRKRGLISAVFSGIICTSPGTLVPCDAITEQQMRRERLNAAVAEGLLQKRLKKLQKSA